jgi:DNA repair protein RecN (Recombination protein N)
MAPEKHFEFIDCIAGDADLLEEYREKFRELCSYIRERDSLRTDESEKLRRLDLLDYQISELEQADIKPGERDELNERKALLQNCERVTASLRAAYDILRGADDSFGVISAIDDCAGNAEDAARFYKDVEPAAAHRRLRA